MKKVISLFLALVMCLSLCACGKTSKIEEIAEEVNALMSPDFFNLNEESWKVKGTLYEENGDPTYAAMLIPISDHKSTVLHVWNETVAESMLPYCYNKVVEYFEGTDVDVCVVVCIDTLDNILFKYDDKGITSF